MKCTLTFLFVFTSILVFAQTPVEEKKFSIALNLKYIDFQSNEEKYDDLDASYGIDLQGGYYYKINDRFLLKTGIGINFITSNSKDYSFIFGCDLQNMLAGSVEENSYVKTTMNWVYMNVPIELQFDLLSDENRIYLKGGLSNMIHLFGDSKALLYECGMNTGEIQNESIATTFDAKRFFGQVNFGLGIETSLNHNMKLFLEPTIEYAFSNVIDIPTAFDEESRSRTLNIGLQTGLRF